MRKTHPIGARASLYDRPLASIRFREEPDDEDEEEEDDEDDTDEDEDDDDGYSE
jgi:ABC-type Zn2+ transport system substrate-binding protein/surface adhesin